VTARGSNDVGVNLWSWSGSRIVGNITVTVSAVVGVQFSLDGANLGAEDTSAPYSVSWDTTTTSNGSHTLTARARDAAGNFCTSTVTVTVSNDTSPKGRKEASTGSLRCADMADFF